MKLILSITLMFIVGCQPLPCKKCGDPCPRIILRKLDKHNLVAAYRASTLGTSLQRQERWMAAANAQEALMAGAYLQPYVWSSCKGNRGSFMLLRLEKPDVRCVAYEETLKTAVKTLVAQGRACWDPDGFWRIIMQHPTRVLYNRP